ncbi:hypothetical protein CYMTET_21270 [Cymbomonas tetramitiformis]|uniref:Uncharacterized protein n=1 Tax=Cymbomonas tetramitiformis TaxID=36881 RepID=A0AAE0G2G0_9CHLO|nr:hypothetical protein CYMTET_21270 [Cymbomonas tetramitiformis]
MLLHVGGLEPRKGVFVIAATNRRDMIDAAMLRPGRLGKQLHIPLPASDNRAAVMSTLTRKTPLAAGLDVTQLAAGPRCEGFSGADLAALVREACMQALRSMPIPEGLPSGDAPPVPVVSMEHFEAALETVFPSVTELDALECEGLRPPTTKI